MAVVRRRRCRTTRWASLAQVVGALDEDRGWVSAQHFAHPWQGGDHPSYCAGATSDLDDAGTTQRVEPGEVRLTMARCCGSAALTSIADATCSTTVRLTWVMIE